MKDISIFRSHLIISFPILLLSAALMSGCGKKEVEFENISESLKPEGRQIAIQDSEIGQQNESFGEGDLESLDKSNGASFSADPESEEYKALYGRSSKPLYPVYFDFDSSFVKPDQFNNLASSGDYLMENESVALSVEGNCDERGTADYNLALGEVRAMNVKQHLVNLGIAEHRISTISFGSQRPLYMDSNEDAWAKNRRADLVLPQ